MAVRAGYERAATIFGIMPVPYSVMTVRVPDYDITARLEITHDLLLFL